MHYKIKSLFLMIFISLISVAAWCQDSKNIFKGDNFELQIHGEVYTYHLMDKENTTIIAVDGIVLRVDEMVIRAKKAAWYPKTQDIYLEEDIEVKGEHFTFRSKQMTYNVKERKGVLQKPTAVIHNIEAEEKISKTELLEIDKGKYLFVTAEKAEIVKENFFMTQIKITTNGYANPFYHIKAREAKYKRNEHIQSWNNTLKIGKIPLFYFPYLAKDLQYNWPWFHISVSQNSQFGFNGTLAVKTSFDDHTILVAADAMELRGLLGKIQYTRVTKTMNLKVNAEGIKENWRGQSKIDLLKPSDDFIKEGKNNSVQSEEDRYRLHGVYKQEMMWNFSFDAEIDKIDATNQFVWKSNNEYKLSQSANKSPFADLSGDLKKGSYRRDYYRSDFFEDKSPENIGQLKWIKGPYMARMIYKFNPNDFSYGEERNNNEELEIKPGVILNVNGLQIADTAIPLYLDSYARLESLEKNVTNIDNSSTSYSSERMALRTAVSTKYSVADFLNTEVYGGFDETGYSNLKFEPKISKDDGILGSNGTSFDFDLETNTKNNMNRFMGIYGGSLSLEAKKLYDLNIRLLGVNGLMHRIVPKIEYIGSSKPNKDIDEIPQFDAIDAIEKDDYILLSLKNFFDVQKAKGWDNLLKIDAWAKYNVDREDEQPWEYITTELQFKPIENLLFRTNFRFHPGDGLNRSISTISYSWENLIALSVSERWEEDFPWQTDVDLKVYIGERYTIETGFTYINKKPPVGNQNRDQFVEYFFAVQRKYHELVFALEYRRDRLFDEQSIGFSIRLF